jgi:hypothetical protein
MWYLYMVLMLPNGYASTGGPIIIDNISTKAVCIERMAQIEQATPKNIERDFGYSIKPYFIIKTCIQK